MAKLAAATDLKSVGAALREGSSPPSPTFVTQRPVMVIVSPGTM